jgi:ATP-dependent Clp protease adaptor protein ClpS
MSYNQYMFGLQSLRRPVAMMAAEADLRFASGTDKPRETEWGPHVAVQEAEPEIRRPPLFKVVLNNDDYTPMEFVVEVLQAIFGIDRNKAVQIMLYVHTRGKGVAGVFTYEIAETKAAQVNEYARQHQHPLLCTLEAV